MKNVLAWIKSNPLTIVAGLVVLVSIGVFVYFNGKSGQLREDISSFASEPDKLRRFTSQTVDLPPPTLGGETISNRGVTFNQATVTRLDEIFSDVTGEAEQTLAAITRVNRAGKTPLMPGMFPDTGRIDPFQFRAIYRDALSTLLGGPEAQASFEQATGVRLPTLNAGLPPSNQELTQRLEVIVREGLQTYGENITEAQRAQLEAEQRARLISTLKARAQSLDIYANPFIGPPTQLNPSFPLSVRPWIFTGTPPEGWRLWESQLEVWIQSDIVEALRRANKIGQVVSTTEDGTEITGNVLNGAVKRLLRCEVLPTYVGLHSMGDVGTLDPAIDGRNANMGGRSNANNRPSGPLPNPPEAAPTQPGSAVAANYFFSPTGRTSNHVFDVRHVRLLLHADFQKLPDLYNAIGSVNYMSVVDQRITGLDEFDFASLGTEGPYLYGTGDIVEVELVIETLWLREWTAPLMPEDSQRYTGVANAN